MMFSHSNTSGETSVSHKGCFIYIYMFSGTKILWAMWIFFPTEIVSQYGFTCGRPQLIYWESIADSKICGTKALLLLNGFTMKRETKKQTIFFFFIITKINSIYKVERRKQMHSYCTLNERERRIKYFLRKNMYLHPIIAQSKTPGLW